MSKARQPTVRQVCLKHFRKRIFRQSIITDSIGQTVKDMQCSSSKGKVTKRHVHSDPFQHLTASIMCPRMTTTNPAAVSDEVFWYMFI